jgi:hypothetical protein
MVVPLCVIGVIGISGSAVVFALDDDPKPCMPTKPAPKKKAPKRALSGCCGDRQINSFNDRLSKLENAINGDHSQKGVIALIAEEAQERKDTDAKLRSDIDAQKTFFGENKAVADKVLENLAWWSWVVIIALILAAIAFVVGLIGWFLPRTQDVVNKNNNNNIILNPSDGASHTSHSSLGLAGAGSDPSMDTQSSANNSPNNAPTTTAAVGQSSTQQVPKPILAPAPRITGISNSISANMIPVSGGWPITIVGENFKPATKVYFGDKESVSVLFDNENRIIAVAPPVEHAGLVNIRLVNPDGQEYIYVNGAHYF